MPSTPSLAGRGATTFAELKAQGIRPEDIDEDWMDDMVKRLFRELKRQLSQVENAKPVEGREDGNLRAANARTLANLERTLERLARLEQQRVLARETKVAAKDDDARAALERKLDQLLEAARAQVPAGESEP